MLINKAKRAEQNLKNLPFLPLQAEQVEFLFSPLEFKAQIIELIRQAKKRIYVTALYSVSYTHLPSAGLSPIFNPP